LAEIDSPAALNRDGTVPATLAADLRAGLERPGPPAGMIADRLRGLEELIVGRYWWRGARAAGPEGLSLGLGL